MFLTQTITKCNLVKLLYLYATCSLIACQEKMPTSLKETDRKIEQLEKSLSALSSYRDSAFRNELLELNKFETDEEVDLDIAAAESSVLIKGVIKNGATPFIKIEQPLPFQEDFSVGLDVKSGRILSDINIPNSGFYLLSVGDEQFDLFLTPGSQLGIVIDTSEYPCIKFQEDLAKENTYLLSKVGRQKDWYTVANNDLSLDLTSFKKKYKKKLAYDLNRISKFSDRFPNADELFIALENNLYNYAYDRSILSYLNQHDTIDINSHIAYENSIDADLFNLYEYRKFEYEYIEAIAGGFDFSKIKNTSERLSYIKAKYQLVSKICQNKLIAEFLKTDIMYEAIKRVNGPSLNSLMLLFYKEIKTLAYRKKISQRYTNIIKPRNGTLAPDLVAYNSDNKKVNLSAYHGKYSFLFVWATWCGPCKLDIKPLNRIKSAYSNQNINFVSISIDSDKSKWYTELMTNRGMNGHQLLIAGNMKSPMVSSFNVQKVPQCILIDPNGIILEIDAPRPSNSSKLHQLFAKYNI